MRSVEFNKTRALGDVVNDTFTFVRENLQPLGRVLVLFVLPPLLFGAVIATGMSGELLAKIMNPKLMEENPGGVLELYRQTFLTPYFALSLLSSLVGYLLLYGVTITFIQQYIKNASLASADIWNHMQGKLGRIFSTVIGGGLLFFAFFLVLYMILVAIVAALTMMGGGGGIAAGIFACCGAIFLSIIVLFAGVVFQLIIPVRMEKPEMSLFASISYARGLLAGRWWQGSGLLFVMFVIVFVMGLVFTIPATIVTTFAGVAVVSEMGLVWKILFYLTNIVSQIGSLLQAMIIISFFLYYYSLVEEKEGTGLSQRIDEMR